MSCHESFCSRQFLGLVCFAPATPSLLSCPLVAPFEEPTCGELGPSSAAGEAPFVAAAGPSLVYWFRPSRLCRLCGGRPPFLGAGSGLGSVVGVSGGIDSEAASAGASSVGGFSGGSLPALALVNSQLPFTPHVPSPFLRSARPLRLLAASARSRSLSRISFSRWLLAAAPRGFCFGADADGSSSSDSITGELLGDLELVR